MSRLARIGKVPLSPRGERAKGVAERRSRLGAATLTFSSSLGPIAAGVGLETLEVSTDSCGGRT